MMKPDYMDSFISEVIRMAWADDVSVDKIRRDKGVPEAAVIRIMRRNMKASSFRLRRKRVSGRGTKREKRSGFLHQD